MPIELSSDDINILVYRYLIENGFPHSAFSFNMEARMSNNPYWISHGEKLPPSALISFLQKAMIYIYHEYHIDDNTGEEIVCNSNFSLFKKHECWFPQGVDVDVEDNTSNSQIPNTHTETYENGNINEKTILTNSTAEENSTQKIHRKHPQRSNKSDKSRKRIRTTHNQNNGVGEEGYFDESKNELESPTDLHTEKTHRIKRQTEDKSYTHTTLHTLPNTHTHNSTEQETTLYEHTHFPTDELLTPTEFMEEIMDDGDRQIIIGPPYYEISKCQKLENYAILLEANNTSSSGTLSEWSPTDNELIVTNFALQVPHLHRIPPNFDGVCTINSFAILNGPTSDGQQINPGTTSTWRSDGYILSTGYNSGHVRLWTKFGELLATLVCADLQIIRTSFSRSGLFLASAAADGKVTVWKLPKDTHTHIKTENDENNTHTCPPSTHTQDNDTPNQNPTHTHKEDAHIQTDEFDENSLEINKLYTPQFVARYSHAGEVIDIDWKDDYILSSGSIDKSVIIYNIHENKHQNFQQESEIGALKWSQNGEYLAIVDSSTVVKVWEGHNIDGQSIFKLDHHTAAVVKAEWLNYGNTSSQSDPILFTISMDKSLISWDVKLARAGKQIFYNTPPTALKVSPNGLYLAVSTYDCALFIYSLPYLELCYTFVDKHVIPHISWSCDDSLLVYNLYSAAKPIVIDIKQTLQK